MTVFGLLGTIIGRAVAWPQAFRAMSVETTSLSLEPPRRAPQFEAATEAIGLPHKNEGTGFNRSLLSIKGFA
jgi:hypothetical protein